MRSPHGCPMNATICVGTGECQRLVRRVRTSLVPVRMTKRERCSACVRFHSSGGHFARLVPGLAQTMTFCSVGSAYLSDLGGRPYVSSLPLPSPRLRTRRTLVLPSAGSAQSFTRAGPDCPFPCARPGSVEAGSSDVGPRVPAAGAGRRGRGRCWCGSSGRGRGVRGVQIDGSEASRATRADGRLQTLCLSSLTRMWQICP